MSSVFEESLLGNQLGNVQLKPLESFVHRDSELWQQSGQMDEGQSEMLFEASEKC